MDIIPHVNDMEDDVFKKHANFRHVGVDFLIQLTDHDIAPGVLDPARSAHDYWHRINTDSYDHEHLEEEQ